MSRNNKELQPNWRPDFRIKSTLPDIKVIRTDFVINFIAVALALFSGLIVLQREYRAFSLHNVIEVLEQRILVAEPDDNIHLKVSERFRDAARDVEELQRFYSSPLSAHEFLADLAMRKPEDLIFSRISVAESVSKVAGKTQLEYRIDLTGEVSELTTLTDFKEILKGLDSLNAPGFVSVVDESMQQRNAKTGSFPCRIIITLTPAQGTTAKTDTEEGSAG